MLAPTPPDIDPSSPRYTKRPLEQPARNVKEMQRRFYRAGEQINGSVIQHHPGSEIIVVDFEDDANLLSLYNEVMGQFSKDQARKQVHFPLPVYFYNKVREQMLYDREFVEGLVDGKTQNRLRNYPGYATQFPKLASSEFTEKSKTLAPLNGEKIQLGAYLEMGVGICRQQAAVIAACMEKAIRENRAPGWKGGAELRANQNSRGGHTWVFLQRNTGEPYVVDPAQGFLGNPDVPGPHWDYNAGYKHHRFGFPGS